MTKKKYPPYQTISHSQVALHPNPKGVIQFIGSFVFGSFPILTYQNLLKFLFDQGYSLIIHRFPFNPFQFNHWQVSLELFEEQQLIQQEIFKIINGEPSLINSKPIYEQPKNYLWLGHSLGCKYIILLEILSNDTKRRKEVLKHCICESKAEKILGELDEQSHYILDQPLVFIAPEISNTVRFLKSSWRMRNPLTQPNQKETICLIEQSQELFNLLGIIAFNRDNIAEDDVTLLVQQIKSRYEQQNKPFPSNLYRTLEGGHFEPLGKNFEIVGNAVSELFQFLLH